MTDIIVNGIPVSVNDLSKDYFKKSYLVSLVALYHNIMHKVESIAVQRALKGNCTAPFPKEIGTFDLFRFTSKTLRFEAPTVVKQFEQVTTDLMKLNKVYNSLEYINQDFIDLVIDIHRKMLILKDTPNGWAFRRVCGKTGDIWNTLKDVNRLESRDQVLDTTQGI